MTSAVLEQWERERCAGLWRTYCHCNNFERFNKVIICGVWTNGAAEEACRFGQCKANARDDEAAGQPVRANVVQSEQRC